MLKNKLNKRDKRGDIGETVTWFIALLIILAIVLVSVWISFALSASKAIVVGDVKTDMGKSVQLAMKTNIAEQLNNENKQQIEDILKQQNG